MGKVPDASSSSVEPQGAFSTRSVVKVARLDVSLWRLSCTNMNDS